MRQFEYIVDDSVYVCRINEELGGIEVTGFRGSGARLKLPERMVYEEREWEVCSIGKKAFLGNRGLRAMILPASVREIGDWAFSQCGQLEGIQLARWEAAGTETESATYPVAFGTGVFSDCPKLQYIAVGTEPEEDLAVLLAAAIHKLVAEDMLKDAELGSEHWYQKWDQRLQAFLNEDDKEGYTDMVLCGEEDIRSNVPEFAAQKRRRKADLCMLRLMYAHLLSKDMKQVYTDYLCTHTKGCESEAAWEAVFIEHGQDLRFYQMFAEIGAITADNIDAMVQDLDAAHAEAKAFLIRYKQEHFAADDVFGMFEL